MKKANKKLSGVIDDVVLVRDDEDECLASMPDTFLGTNTCKTMVFCTQKLNEATDLLEEVRDILNEVITFDAKG